ncbi:MAG: nitrous oxide reductase accessory protein NosL [Rhodoferax sp.]|uniref:nitrous oxide reductase accessory protein NosL n=1 Tax=Rhodoferax sp. TaxID=50421 RepID=UPI0026167C45|nr:nitrous oxide reductase accessory protein NosL [Rhodoferax sp.]MDD2881114.1 nitrous oxide reductase accessory protein NosL [Rhodoferax sp.]
MAYYVTDVISRLWIEARSAFYVTGSTAKGPMRAGNLPAFISTQEAEQFTSQRGGKVLGFADVDDALVAKLGGQAVHAY